MKRKCIIKTNDIICEKRIKNCEYIRRKIIYSCEGVWAEWFCVKESNDTEKIPFNCQLKENCEDGLYGQEWEIY